MKMLMVIYYVVLGSCVMKDDEQLHKTVKLLRMTSMHA